jgi:endonuclease/exonuclease/phosphatase family metal-dependent hydrolase
MWILAEPGRGRQARSLAAALDDGRPTVVGGDLNSWFGFHDSAYKELARRFPRLDVRDRRPTFGPLRLDHMFFRLPDGWRVEMHRADDRFGSDHYPLIAIVTIPRSTG